MDVCIQGANYKIPWEQTILTRVPTPRPSDPGLDKDVKSTELKPE